MSRSPLLSGALVGALVAVLATGVGALLLVQFERTRALLDVRSIPLVLHGGLAPPEVLWQQELRPMAGRLYAVRLAAVDFAGGDAAGAPRLELHDRVGGLLAGPLEGHFERAAGLEGRLLFTLEEPLELTGESILARVVPPASGQAAAYALFLRARGPRIHLAGGIDRTHEGLRFVREVRVPETGPGPLAALVLHVRAVDLYQGPARATLFDVESGDPVAQAESAFGWRQREGHLVLHLPEVFDWGRAQALRAEFDLPGARAVLLGDAQGPAIGALLGRPGAAEQLGMLERGSARLADLDLAFELRGDRPWAASVRATLAAGAWRLSVAALLGVAVGAALGAAFAAACSRVGRTAPADMGGSR